jgi:hypothetical protein
MMLLIPTPTAETDPLTVAVVSVALTVVVVGVTALLARTGEHAKWVRERRYDAYVAFMIDMATLATLIEIKPSLANFVKTRARIDAYLERVSAAYEAVSLLGPREVNAAGQNWVWSAVAYSTTRSASDKTAVAAARWQFLVAAGKILNSKNVTAVPMANPDVATSAAAAQAVG